MGDNARAVVDTKSMLVDISSLTQASNDKSGVVPALEKLAALPESLGQVTHLLADTSFHRTKNVAACEKHGIEPLIAVKLDEHRPAPTARFGFQLVCHCRYGLGRARRDLRYRKRSAPM